MRDLIDRQQAIDEFWKLEIEARPSWIDAVMNMLNSLPSAQPNVYVSTKDADCISRSQALNAINVGGDLEGAWINVAKLPSAQPEKTCCGYDVKELIAFAIACRRAEVDEKDLKCFAQNCESAWKVMQEEFNNAIKETLEKW